MPLAAILAGLAVGLLVAILGGGGSLFLVPVLLLGFDQDLPRATGTALLVMLAAALVGTAQHARLGTVRFDVALRFGPASMAGAALGALLHARAPERLTAAIFILCLLAAAASMVRAPSTQRQGSRPSWPRLLALGVGVGVITGFVGVGGGFLIVPVLVLWAGLSMVEAVGTSVALIALAALSGAVSHYAAGHFDLALALPMALGAVFGALAGAPLAGRVPERPLRLGFAVLVLVAAAAVGVRAFGQ